MTIPPKWFYDEKGSALFDAITQLPELVDPTRAKIDDVLIGADAAVTTLQDQIQAVMTELDAAQAAALAAALTRAL